MPTATFPKSGGNYCNAPEEFCSPADREALEQQDYSANKERYFRFVPIFDFPRLFYTIREARFDDSAVPFYAQVLMRKPREHDGYPVRTASEARAELESIVLLAEDLQRFPLDYFTDHLFKIKDIKLRFDIKEPNTACAEMVKGEKLITFKQKLKQNYANPLWIEAVLLHELYHFVEKEPGDNIPGLFSTFPRWNVVRRRDSMHIETSLKKAALKNTYHGLNSYDINWNDGKGNTIRYELSDILEALTIIRYPQITSTLDPYVRYVSNLVHPQLAMPPTKNIWNESSRP